MVVQTGSCADQNCRNCGNQISETSKFCSNCGQKLGVSEQNKTVTLDSDTNLKNQIHDEPKVPKEKIEVINFALKSYEKEYKHLTIF